MLGTLSWADEYQKGRKIFREKCSSCHTGYISPDKIKDNFFNRDNTLLKLKAPTENMLAYAIIDGPKHIGDPDDPEMREDEIAEFLKDYLEKPNRENSICDKNVMKFYETKRAIKGITENEYLALAKFFMEYKSRRVRESYKSIKKFNKKDYDEESIIREARRDKRKIIIEATSRYCHYCKSFKREVLASEEVSKLIDENFIFVEVDVDRDRLPFGLEKIYQKITPSFFFLDSNGEIIEHYPGSWRKRDFIRILSSIKGG
jgi:thioredoxin-related protein